MKVIPQSKSRIAALASMHIPLLGIALIMLSAPSFANEQEALAWEHDDPELEWGPCPAFMPDSCRIAVLQGDPAKANADVFFRLASNTTAPNHWHHSAERMVLVAGEMKVDYEGQEPVILEPGTYAYGPPEKPHVATCQSEEDCVLFIAFEEPVDAFAVEE